MVVAIRGGDGVWRKATCQLPIDDKVPFNGVLTLHIGAGAPTAVDVVSFRRTTMDQRQSERREHISIPLES